MIEYRAGQRVRIEIEGTLVNDRNCLRIQWDGGFGATFAVNGRPVQWVKEGIVTILSEPRPDEPRGLGAVVEASWRDRGRELFIRARRDKYQWRPEREYSTTDLYVPWDDLIDPVVLSEGWTP